MNASTEPTDWHSDRSKALSVAHDWLQALSQGTCDATSVVNGIDAVIRGDPEAAWEVLSVVDQSYRLGKIEGAAFQTINAHLVRFALGADRDLASRPRVPAVQTATDRRLNLTVPVGPDATPASVAPPPAAPDSAAAERSVSVGDVLRGRYRITGVLGRGGMGTVFEAVDLDGISHDGGARPLAIKVLHPAVTRRPELFAELRSEFQSLQSLSHPNIVRVHEFDRDGGIAFFTMELLRGMPLAALVAGAGDGTERGPRRLAIIDAIGAALAHAHQRGIVHGDVNPGNVFVTREGEVRVLDFGASRVMETGDARAPGLPAVAAPGYASCQVLEGRVPEVRDDIFAFACVVYLLLMGKPPYGDLTALEARDVRATPSRPPDIDDGQWRGLLEALAFDRDARPADVHEWLARLTGTTPPRESAQAPVALAAPAPVPVAESAPVAAPGARSRHGLRNFNFAMLTTTLVVLAVFAWWKFHHGGFSERPPEPLGERPAVPVARAPPTRPAAAPVPAAPTAPTAPAADRVNAPAEALAPAVSPPPAVSAAPADAPVAAHAHVALAEAVLVVGARDTLARVTVLRNGNPDGVASFTWWTAAGTARSGVDFDRFAPHVAKFPVGARSLELRIPLHPDTHRPQARNFYVMIAPSAPDFSPVTRHTTMIKIKAAR
jgi:serine/threonine protein kinase